MSDALESERKFRVLNVMDDFNREGLINEVYYSNPAKRFVNTFKQFIQYRLKSKKIRTDTGPEFLSKKFVDFCNEQQTELCYIQPEKPVQIAFIERLNRIFREDVLDANLFKTLYEVYKIDFDWQIDYNKNQPNKYLNGKSPW